MDFFFHTLNILASKRIALQYVELFKTSRFYLADSPLEIKNEEVEILLKRNAIKLK